MDTKQTDNYLPPAHSAYSAGQRKPDPVGHRLNGSHDRLTQIQEISHLKRSKYVSLLHAESYRQQQYRFGRVDTNDHARARQPSFSVSVPNTEINSRSIFKLLFSVLRIYAVRIIILYRFRQNVSNPHGSGRRSRERRENGGQVHSFIRMFMFLLDKLIPSSPSTCTQGNRRHTHTCTLGSLGREDRRGPADGIPGVVTSPPDEKPLVPKRVLLGSTGAELPSPPM